MQILQFRLLGWRQHHIGSQQYKFFITIRMIIISSMIFNTKLYIFILYGGFSILSHNLCIFNFMIRSMNAFFIITKNQHELCLTNRNIYLRKFGVITYLNSLLRVQTISEYYRLQARTHACFWDYDFPRVDRIARPMLQRVPITYSRTV